MNLPIYFNTKSVLEHLIAEHMVKYFMVHSSVISSGHFTLSHSSHSLLQFTSLILIYPLLLSPSVSPTCHKQNRIAHKTDPKHLSSYFLHLVKGLWPHTGSWRTCDVAVKPPEAPYVEISQRYLSLPFSQWFMGNEGTCARYKPLIFNLFSLFIGFRHVQFNGFNVAFFPK